VKKVFHEPDNAVAVAIQYAKDLLKTLEAQGGVLAEYLAKPFHHGQPTTAAVNGASADVDPHLWRAHKR
jgi:hypothetical protein